jgi:hypothetical protein
VAEHVLEQTEADSTTKNGDPEEGIDPDFDPD